MKAKAFRNVFTTKRLAEQVSEEEDTQKRANILLVGPGKGTGGCLGEEGEGMLQSSISLSGVFYSSGQCIVLINIRTLPDSNYQFLLPASFST